MELCVETLRLKGYAIALWLHTSVDPPKNEWDEAMDRLVADTRTVKVSDMRHFVMSDGGAPGAAQRGRMHKELARGQPLRLAVVTTVLSNPLKRGIATAMNWANPDIRFFLPAQTRDALAHVDLAEEAATIWASYSAMQEQLRPVKVIRDVAGALGMPLRGGPSTAPVR